LVQRIGLTLQISHPRLNDLRIKVIAPSGRAVEVDVGLERASSNTDIRIPPSQLKGLVGESIGGTWSISFRDETIGVAGHLVGWNLRLNSQVLVEDFQRGLSIPDPVERETENVWVDVDGKYAVARATQSDSARIWDLSFAKPIATLAISENERIIGIDKGARTLATGTLETVHLWDTASGRLLATLPIGAASQTSMLTRDGKRVFAQYRSDAETRLEFWSLATGNRDGELLVAGTPALIALDSSGYRLAIADYDRAVRIWDVKNRKLVAQIDLPMQPSSIALSTGGRTLGAVYGTAGVSMWNVDAPQMPVLEQFGEGRWRLEFSQSGARVLVGRSRGGYRLRRSDNGQPIGPALGVADETASSDLLAFAQNEAVVVTGSGESSIRFWQLPVSTGSTVEENSSPTDDEWDPSHASVVAALPDGSGVVLGDREGHVHILRTDPAQASADFDPEDVHYLGHTDVVRRLAVSTDGTRVASAAQDNTIRVWDSSAGLPSTFIADFAGSPITKIQFSRDASLLGILAVQQVAVMDVESGDILAEFELAAQQSAIAFGVGTAM
ncbi:MAG: proprotein convertase P-domain-containing protein, partial [Phycisphaerales bacterium]|nr:proprotein convertase P-domain-containing protein [Phycisphaerales bacterium]